MHQYDQPKIGKWGTNGAYELMDINMNQAFNYGQITLPSTLTPSSEPGL